VTKSAEAVKWYRRGAEIDPHPGSATEIYDFRNGGELAAHNWGSVTRKAKASPRICTRREVYRAAAQVAFICAACLSVRGTLKQ